MLADRKSGPPLFPTVPPQFPPASVTSFANLAPKGFPLRAARDSDLAFLRRLYRSTRAEELTLVPWTEAQKTEFLHDQFDLQHKDWISRLSNCWFLVVMHRGAPMGRLYLNPPGASFHVVDISILASQRNQGLGTALLSRIQAIAAAGGMPVTLQVRHDNPGARALYDRLGFVPGEPTARDTPMTWKPR